MRTHPNELFFYYNPTHNIDKQMRAYAKSIATHVNEINIEKEKITMTGWRSILEKLNLRPKDLMNRAHPDYQSKIAGRSWDEESWLNILIRNPHLIKAPIAIRKDKAVLCITPHDILNLD